MGGGHVAMVGAYNEIGDMIAAVIQRCHIKQPPTAEGHLVYLARPTPFAKAHTADPTFPFGIHSQGGIHKQLDFVS